MNRLQTTDEMYVLCPLCHEFKHDMIVHRSVRKAPFPICLDCHLEIMDLVNDAEAVDYE